MMVFCASFFDANSFVISQSFSLSDFYLDEALQRKIKRVREAERRRDEIEDEEEEEEEEDKDRV